jgi:preprotein translocase subunit SecG
MNNKLKRVISIVLIVFFVLVFILPVIMTQM